MTKGLAVPKKPLEVKTFRSRREAALRQELAQTEHVAELLERVTCSINPNLLRRELLRNCMKVTRRMAPELHELVDLVRKIIDVGERDFEIFVFPCETIQAWASATPGDATVYIGFGSCIFEKLSRREELNILGHEIGHVVAGHPEFPIGNLLSSGSDVLSTLDVYKLMALSRYMEVTADRAGLLCCQDYEVATGCLLKTTSGVTSGKIHFHLKDYLGQLEEIRSLGEIEQGSGSEDWFATHPFSPLRVKGLELFSRSDLFGKFNGDVAGALKFKEMEAKLDEFMQIMNPSYMTDTEDETSYQVREWLTLSSVFVALVNDVLEDSEVDKIARTVGHDAFAGRIDEIRGLGPQGTWELIVGVTEPVSIKTTPARRLQMVRDLVLIAVADGTIDDAEYQALVNLAGLLCVTPHFVDQVCQEAHAELISAQEGSRE